MVSEVKVNRLRLKGHESGQAIVEFAFVSVFLLMLVGGIIDGARVMRYKIIMSGAVTEVVNQITIKESTDIGSVCAKVLSLNYQYELGDGMTNCTFNLNSSSPDNFTYQYHEYNGGSTELWTGKRNGALVSVSMEREIELFTPFGRLIFGDGGGGTRLVKTSASTRIYTD